MEHTFPHIHLGSKEPTNKLLQGSCARGNSGNDIVINGSANSHMCRENHEANARLIRAAPEMLGALEEVLQWIPDGSIRINIIKLIDGVYDE